MGQNLGHVLGLDLELVHRVPGRGRVRDGDVDDLQLAAVFQARKHGLAQLGRAEGAGQIGLHGRAHDLARVRADPGGDIHRDDERLAGVDQADDLLVPPFYRGVEARAQQRVHHQVGLLQVKGQVLHAFLVQDLHNGQVQGLDGLEVHGRIALDGVQFSQDVEDHLRAPAVQPAADHEPVPAVVAPAADNGRAQALHRFQGLLDQLGQPFSGVLHEDHAGQTRLLHGPGVKGSHLLGQAQGFHRSLLLLPPSSTTTAAPTPASSVRLTWDPVTSMSSATFLALECRTR